MNNLWIVLSIGLVGASFALRQTTERLELRRHTIQLRGAVAEAEADLAALRESVTAAQKGSVAAANELSIAENRLAQVRHQDQNTPQKHPDVAGEGVWPDDKSYFHLAKRHLAVVGYPLFNSDNHLSPTAATLFGVTEAEKAEIEASARQYSASISHLLESHAARIPTSPEDDTDERKQVTFIIRKVGEDAAAIQEDFHHSLERTLGAERADLFFAKAEAWMYEKTGDVFSGWDVPEYRVKLEAKRNGDGTVTHMIWFGNGEGSNFHSGMGVSIPPEGRSQLTPYIGLFGGRPLLEDHPLPSRP